MADRTTRRRSAGSPVPAVPAGAPDEPQTPSRSMDRPGHREVTAHPSEQPLRYPLERAFAEPDWTRLPAYRHVTAERWESAQWQRAHTVKNLKELKDALGSHLTDELAGDIQRDMLQRATMSMLLPPQMINTMNEADLYADPVRRYMAPALSDRQEGWASHPY